MDYSSCPNDATFGPAVHGCSHRDFDFTLKFEAIFLSILPAAIFIVLAIARGIWLFNQPAIVKGQIFQYSKAVFIALYAALRFTSFVLSIVWRGEQAALFISSATIEVVAIALALPLSFFEHARSPRPSTLLSSYLILSLLFDIPRTRSFWLLAETSAENAFAAVFTAAVGVKAVAFLAESQIKTRWIEWDAASHSPEEMTGFFGLAVYSWTWKLFSAGREKVLTVDDLFPLDSRMSSDSLRVKLQAARKNSPNHKDNHRLAKALAKSLSGSFLLPIGPRLALSAFKFCQPFLINALLSYLLIPSSERPVNYGYGLIGATFLVYGGIAVSTAIYYYLRERTIWMVRGALSSSIYEQTLRSKLSVVSDASVLTLMSTDIERTRPGLTSIHEFWASFIETGVALWLLYRELGVAFVAPIVVVVVCVVIVALASHLSGPRQNLWMEKIQERVGALSHVVGNMKALKIAGLAESAETLIQHLREVEVGIGGNWRMIIVLFVIIGFSPSMLGPLFTFAVTARDLDTTRVFTSLSFLVLLTEPLSQLFQYIPFLTASFTCLTRIQNFLEEECCEDFREDADLTPFKDEKKEDELNNSSNPGALIQISDGSFGWEKDKLTLSNLSFSIPANSLTIVVGPTACGKSTLLKAMLGETPVHDGRVLIEPTARRIGYCDQTTFLTNASVKENILGYSSFDEKRYNEVLEATMLLPDLALLPQGDLTKVGSNGVSLSGGQRQRVSMARALYSDFKLFFFDDTLSGLDADTEEQVFQRIFGANGLIRRRNATAVLCTHAVRHLPSADHIIALSQDGLIVEQGTFDDLASLGGYIQSLEVQAKKSSGNLPSDSSSIVSTTEKGEESATATATARTPPPAMWSAADEHSRKTRDWSVYKKYAGSMKPITLLAFVVVGAALGFFSNYPQIWLNYWSADVASSHRAHSQGYWIGIYAVFNILCLVCIGVICAILFVFMTAQSGTSLHHETLRTVIGAPLRFFTTVDAGIVTNLFSQDISLVDVELPQALLNVTAELSISIGMAVVVATASPYIAISYPFIAILLWVIQKLYLPTSRQLRLLDLETKSPLYTQFTDTVTGVATLRAFGWAQQSLDFNLGLLDNSQRPAYFLAMIQHCLAFVLSALVAVLATLVVVLVTQVKAITGAGLAGASMVSLMTIGDYLSSLILFYTLLEISIGAVSRLKSFQETVLPESSPDEDAVLPPLWPLKGSLIIKSVSASYSNESNQSLALEDSGSNSDTTDLVLKNFSINIAPGEKVAICGRSGSGKSSLLLLLLRLLDPLPACADGITIDDIPLNRVSRAILRQRVIAVPQDSIFFPDGNSFKTNLDPSDIATESDCKEVLRSVGLWQAVEDNGGLNGSLSTSMLSHGQRQLFGFARAILRRRIRSNAARTEIGGSDGYLSSTFEKGGDIGGMLLLDEVGSSVDKDTEGTIQRLIREEFPRYTTIAISHRLDTVMDFDRVIVMDKGSVVESGHPLELLKREEGAFKSLWTAGGREV